MNRQLISIVLLAVSVVSANAYAAVQPFEVPLTFSEYETDNGRYLSAEYDAGTSFSRVDRVELRLTVPDGYQGYSIAVGFGSYSEDLGITLAETRTIPSSALVVNEPQMNGQVMAARASERVSVELVHGLWIDPTLAIAGVHDQPNVDWPTVLNSPPLPEFVFSGRGHLSIGIVGSRSGDSVFLPNIDQAFLRLPPRIEDVRLVFTGIAVPEPTSWLLLLGTCLGVEAARRSVCAIGLPRVGRG